MSPGRDQTWIEAAACKDTDTDIWFPQSSGRGQSLGVARELARLYCNNCPVRLRRLDDALEMDDDTDGIRAGLTAGQRKRLRRKQSRSDRNSIKLRRAREAELRSSGLSTPLIAAEFGVSPAQVLRDLAAMNGQVSAPGKVRAADGRLVPSRTLTRAGKRSRQRRAVKLVVEQGLSLAAAAEKTGWSRETLRADLIRAGVDRIGNARTRDGRLVPVRASNRAELEERRARARALKAQGWRSPRSPPSWDCRGRPRTGRIERTIVTLWVHCASETERRSRWFVAGPGNRS